MKINLYTYIHITTNKFISENNNFQEFLTISMQLKIFISEVFTNEYPSKIINFIFFYIISLLHSL